MRNRMPARTQDSPGPYSERKEILGKCQMQILMEKNISLDIKHNDIRVIARLPGEPQYPEFRKLQHVSELVELLYDTSFEVVVLKYWSISRIPHCLKR
jgi:hypothetical protein